MHSGPHPLVSRTWGWGYLCRSRRPSRSFGAREAHGVRGRYRFSTRTSTRKDRDATTLRSRSFRRRRPIRDPRRPASIRTSVTNTAPAVRPPAAAVTGLRGSGSATISRGPRFDTALTGSATGTGVYPSRPFSDSAGTVGAVYPEGLGGERLRAFNKTPATPDGHFVKGSCRKCGSASRSCPPFPPSRGSSARLSRGSSPSRPTRWRPACVRSRRARCRRRPRFRGAGAPA
jgi:hypothetical protein